MSGDCQTQTGDAFKASVYKDDSANQIVIAVRGTDPPGNDGFKPFAKNMLANLSLWGDGSANEQVGRYVESLAKILHLVQEANPTANITLTGHSLGGALSQVVGDSAGVRTITFDAPGIKDVLTSAQLDDLVARLAHITYRSASDSREIVNYRLQEDQVSLVGKGSLIEKNRQFGEVYTVWNPHAGLNRDFLQNHSITELVSLLRDNCAPAIAAPSVCLTRGYGPDEGVLFRALTAVARVACPSLPGAIRTGLLLVKALCEGVEIAAKHADVLVIDPAPGDQYFVAVGDNSPEIAFLGLPRLPGVDGWALRYHDQDIWSDFVSKLGYGQFDFSEGVDAVEFFPTDGSGNRVFNTNWFSYDIRFDRDGAVGLFQASVGQVSEPSTALLTGVSLLAMIAAGRFRRKRCLVAGTSG